MCTEVILVRSVFGDENKYYLQVFLKERLYIRKLNFFDVWKMNNPVAIKSAGREYYGKNKERVREYAQICYHLKNNKGKTKIYYTGKNIKKEFNDMYERAREEKEKKEL